MDILDENTLIALVEGKLPREAFGPESARPYLAIDLAGTGLGYASWLRDLPCPTIGIGSGALSDACDVVLEDPSGLARITANIEKAPVASMILVQHLRASETLSLLDTLTAESFAYATVQKGPEFLNWLAKKSAEGSEPAVPEQPLDIELDDTGLRLVMNDPDNLNAIGVTMRDALCEALDMALADDDLTKISLTGVGRCFSTGGEVAEFGEVFDPATAHWMRCIRLPAWRLARLRNGLNVHVNGAAVGAGAEIAAFGAHVTATREAWFQLPELTYGLIPGAGGTASLPRRIGRQRTAYLALSMKKINAQTALDWGLVDEIVS